MLDQLLQVTRPLSSEADEAVWAAERFFIVVHQTSELWVSQIFVDLGRAEKLARDGQWDTALLALNRIAGILSLLQASLEQLEHLEVHHFRTFRPLLEGISAAQSTRIMELLSYDDHPAVKALRQASRNWLADVAHSENIAVANVDAKLVAISTSVRRWRQLHLETARRLIADARGTGGTEGVTYLERQLLSDGATRSAPGHTAPESRTQNQ